MGGGGFPCSPFFTGSEIIRLLSIDQASQKSGWAMYIDGKYVEAGLIHINSGKKKEDPETVFKKMCLYLRDIIIKKNPDYVVFEGISLQTNPAVVLLLGRVQGAIVMTCLDRKIPYEIIPASTWRKILCFNQGRGIARNQLKDQAIEYIKTNFGIQAMEDIAEAMCMGYAFIIRPEKDKEIEDAKKKPKSKRKSNSKTSKTLCDTPNNG